MDSRGRNTSLHIASETGDLRTVKMLLERGVNPNVINKIEKATPLILAAQGGFTEVCDELIKHNANVNYQGQGGQSALHWACLKGYTETAQLLLNHNADYNASDSSFGTVAMVTIAHGHLETLKLILEHIASHEGCSRSPRKKNSTPYNRYFQRIVNRHATGLCTAIRKDHVDIVEYFLQNEINVSIQDHHGRSPLSYAVEKQDVPLVDRLLSLGASVNMADSNKSQDFIVPSLFWTFIQKSSKPSSNQIMTPVMWAASKGNLTILQQLVEHGADLKVVTEVENNTKEKDKDSNKTEQPKICLSLYLAAKGGHYDCTKYILDHRIVHDHVLNSGWLAMVETCCHGNIQCIDMLLRYGIEPNKSYLPGKWPTILTQAAQLGYSDCISMLHTYAADVNQKDDFGYTPLIMSVKEQRYDCCQVLLNLGAYINLRSDDYFGGSALFYAAQDGELDIVLQLLSKGADTNLRCVTRKSPLSPESLSYQKNHMTRPFFFLYNNTDL